MNSESQIAKEQRIARALNARKSENGNGKGEPAPAPDATKPLPKKERKS